MCSLSRFLSALVLCALPLGAPADIIVDYTVDAGGNNTEPLNGLSARATFSRSSRQLSILLENTSTGTPASFDVADSLLVSMGFNLPPGIRISSGDAAVIGPGALGAGSWSARMAGDSVAEEWLWTNDFGGDLMESFAQVISTSNGQGGGVVTRFDLGGGTVGGPFGGVAASPPLLRIPDNQPAISGAALFTLTLNAAITETELDALARGSMVEFGSDTRYLVPEPASLALLPGPLALCLRRR